MNDHICDSAPAVTAESLRQYIQRPARSSNIDGSTELAWGMFCLCGSLVLHLALPHRSALSGMSSFVLWLGMVILPISVPALIKRFVTSRRTGYVVLDRGNTRKARVLGFVLGITFGVVLALALLARQRGWLHSPLNSGVRFDSPQTLGILIAVVCNPILYLMVNASAFKEHVWKWMGVAALTLGPLAILAFAQRPQSDSPASALPNTVSFFISAVWLLSGGLALVLYILRHPVNHAEIQ